MARKGEGSRDPKTQKGRKNGATGQKEIEAMAQSRNSTEDCHTM
jgi:hypothetical protein